MNVHRRDGIHTSGIVWWFMFTSVMLCLPELYTCCMFYNYKNQDTQYGLISRVTFVIHCTANIILFVLSCISDGNKISNQNTITSSSLEMSKKNIKFLVIIKKINQIYVPIIKHHISH